MKIYNSNDKNLIVPKYIINEFSKKFFYKSIGGRNYQDFTSTIDFIKNLNKQKIFSIKKWELHINKVNDVFINVLLNSKSAEFNLNKPIDLPLLKKTLKTSNISLLTKEFIINTLNNTFKTLYTCSNELNNNLDKDDDNNDDITIDNSDIEELINEIVDIFQNKFWEVVNYSGFGDKTIYELYKEILRLVIEYYIEETNRGNGVVNEIASIVLNSVLSEKTGQENWIKKFLKVIVNYEYLLGIFTNLYFQNFIYGINSLQKNNNIDDIDRVRFQINSIQKYRKMKGIFIYHFIEKFGQIFYKELSNKLDELVMKTNNIETKLIKKFTKLSILPLIYPTKYDYYGFNTIPNLKYSEILISNIFFIINILSTLNK